MKPSLLAALALLGLCSLSPAEPISAVSWNIEWFPGGRPNASEAEQTAQLEGCKSVLPKMGADILLAQEVTDAAAFDELVSSVPGMKVHVFSQFLQPDSDRVGLQQCAIASKLEAHSAWFEAFKPSSRLPNLRRGFAFAALEHPSGGLMMFYCVHLKSNGGSDTPKGERDVAKTRKESVKQIVAHKKEMEKRFATEKIVGWVVGGDFNTNHDGQFPRCTVVQDLEAAGFYNTWTETNKQERATWLSDPDPEKRRFQPTTFDYFMTTGFLPAEAKMIPNIPRELSDHGPIVLELSLPKN
ncbi:MAG: endonuclease/exonuclease/phosphatase family protein [Roseibacillus sp.]